MVLRIDKVEIGNSGEKLLSKAVAMFGAHNLAMINRGLTPPSFEHLLMPRQYGEGGLVGDLAGSGSDSKINLGIQLEEGLVLKHLGSKKAGNIIVQHLANNPKAAAKALSRSQ